VFSVDHLSNNECENQDQLRINTRTRSEGERSVLISRQSGTSAPCLPRRPPIHSCRPHAPQLPRQPSAAQQTMQDRSVGTRTITCPRHFPHLISDECRPPSEPDQSSEDADWCPDASSAALYLIKRFRVLAHPVLSPYTAANRPVGRRGLHLPAEPRRWLHFSRSPFQARWAPVTVYNRPQVASGFFPHSHIYSP
jgi:hypothetical protein